MSKTTISAGSVAINVKRQTTRLGEGAEPCPPYTLGRRDEQAGHYGGEGVRRRFELRISSFGL